MALSLALVRSASVGCDWLEGLSFLPGGSVVISLVSRGGFSCVPELGSLGSGVGGSPELGSLGSGRVVLLSWGHWALGSGVGGSPELVSLGSGLWVVVLLSWAHWALGSGREVLRTPGKSSGTLLFPALSLPLDSVDVRLPFPLASQTGRRAGSAPPCFSGQSSVLLPAETCPCGLAPQPAGGPASG